MAALCAGEVKVELKLEYLFFAVFALVIGSFVFKILKHGGFKAAMFGAGIKSTAGEVSGSGQKLMRLTLRVHELDASPDRAIGIELVAKSIASYQMMPITLSASEAKKLTELINGVVNGTQNT